MVSISLMPFSSSRSCSSRSSSGTGLRLLSISLSSALPATDIFECLREETLPANWAASRDNSSANLKRALRENVVNDVEPGESTDAMDTMELLEPRRDDGRSSGFAMTSYTEGDHRARVARKDCKSAKIFLRSAQAPTLCSSHVSLVPIRSKLSERSRKRCSSLSSS